MEKPTETLKQACRRIQQGLILFRKHTETAAALIWEAKTKQVWREDFFSWKEFCEKGCGFTRQWADELFKSYQTRIEIEHWFQIQNVKQIDGPDPKNKEILANLNSRQAQALKGLPPAKKAEVFNAAIAEEDGRSPRPETIAKVRDSILMSSDGRNYSGAYSSAAPDRDSANGESTIVVVDAIGFPVPDAALPYWNRAQEIQDMLTALSRIKGILKKAEDEQDIMFAEVNFSDSFSKLMGLWENIKSAKPYAVCGTCQGKNPAKCRSCCGRGVVSQFRWNTVLPEIKAMREKATRV